MKLGIDQDDLLIILEGWERLWALQRGAVLPRKRITRMQFHETFATPSRIIWRIGGTAAPGLLYAGHFRSQGSPYFLYVRKPRGWPKFTAQNVLEIVAKNDSGTETTILLTVEPEQARAALRWYNPKQ